MRNHKNVARRLLHYPVKIIYCIPSYLTNINNKNLAAFHGWTWIAKKSAKQGRKLSKVSGKLWVSYCFLCISCNHFRKKKLQKNTHLWNSLLKCKTIFLNSISIKSPIWLYLLNYSLQLIGFLVSSASTLTQSLSYPS